MKGTFQDVVEMNECSICGRKIRDKYSKCRPCYIKHHKGKEDNLCEICGFPSYKNPCNKCELTLMRNDVK